MSNIQSTSFKLIIIKDGLIYNENKRKNISSNLPTESSDTAISQNPNKNMSSNFDLYVDLFYVAKDNSKFIVIMNNMGNTLHNKYIKSLI